MKKTIVLMVSLAVIILLTACSGSQTPVEAVSSETAAIIPSDTPAIPTSTSTMIPSPTSTATPLPTATPKFINPSNVSSVELLYTFSISHGVGDIEFSPDTRYIAFGGESAQVIVHSLANGELVAEINTILAVQSLSWSPDGSLLAAGLSSGRIMIIDANNWEDLFTINLDYPNDVTDIDWSPNGEKIVIQVAQGNHLNGKVVIWDLANQELLSDLTPRPGGPGSVCWDRDSEQISILWSEWPNSEWILFNSETLEIDERRGLSYRGVLNYCTSSGEIILGENRSGVIYFLDPTTLEVKSMISEESYYSRLCISPETAIFVQRTGDYSVLSFWDFPVGELIGEIETQPFHYTTFSSDCSTIGLGGATKMREDETFYSEVEVWGLP